VDPRKTAIVSLLDRTKKFDGIRVDGATILRLNARKKAAGGGVIEGPLRGILDPSTFATVQRAISTGCYAAGLESCVPVAGFGWILGESVVCTLGKSNTENKWSLDLAALWNLLVAYFDELCDEYGSLLPLLLTRISPASLRAALHPGLSKRLAPEPTDPVLLRFVLEIADEVFSRFRSLAERVSDQDFRRLGQAIEMAYASEIKTAQLRFSVVQNSQGVHRHLRGSGSLPVWILGCISALASGLASLPKRLDSSLEYIGDVIWLLDDLIDVEKDVGTDRWNAIFLVAAERHGPSLLPKLRLLSSEDRMAWLYENKMAEVLANRIFETLRFAIEGLDETFGKGSPLAKDLVSILWSFANEIPDHN
jgi:hypothetical protein